MKIPDYFTFCKTLYNSIDNFKFDPTELEFSKGIDGYLKVINPDLGWKDLSKLYRDEIELLINEKFSEFDKEFKYIKNLKEISFYEEAIAGYTCLYLFWLWEHKFELPLSDQKKILRAMFCGTIGYRIIDVFFDHKKLGPEVIFLGNYLIRYSEIIFMEVFGKDDVFEIISENYFLYAKAEYLEKRFIGKTSPFSWDKPEEIGAKSGPMFSVFVAAFKKSGMDYEKFNELKKGLQFTFSAVQIGDDLIDAKEDLNSGYETLIMKGFYEQFGNLDVITQEHINQFLTNEKKYQIYETVMSLFDQARQIYKKHNEGLLHLYNEIQNYKFNDFMKFEETPSK